MLAVYLNLPNLNAFRYPFATDVSPGYEVAYIYSSYIAYIVVMMFSSADGMFISFCLYISAQFKNIQTELSFMMSAIHGINRRK